MKLLKGENQSLADSQFLEKSQQIFFISQKLNNRNKTRNFFLSLLEEKKMRKFYSYIYYYISLFHPITEREEWLTSSLKYSDTVKKRLFSLSQLVLLFRQRGMAAMEMSYLQKLNELQRISGDFLGSIQSYSTLGTMAISNRQYMLALKYFQEALKIGSDLKDKSIGNLYLKVSEIFRMINKRELARKYWKKALDCSLKTRDKSLKIDVFYSSAKLFFEKKDYSQALRSLELALSIIHEGTKTDLTGKILYLKALILIDFNRHDEAISLIKDAIHTPTDSTNEGENLAMMVDFAEYLFERNSFTEYANIQKKINSQSELSPDFLFFRNYLYALRWESREDWDQALFYYQKTFSGLNRYFSHSDHFLYCPYKNTVNKMYDRVVLFYLKRASLTGNNAMVFKALQYWETIQSFYYITGGKSTAGISYLQREIDQVESDFLRYNRRYVQLLSQDSASEEIPYFEEKLDLLKKQYVELKELIIEQSGSTGTRPTKEFDLKIIQKKLNPRQLVIRYMLLRDQGYAFYINHETIGYVRLKYDTEKILTSLNDLTKPMDDFARGDVDYLRIHFSLGAAHQLYQILLQDILAIHPETKEICFIPDGELYKVPFEALVTGFNQKPLIPDVIFSEYLSADYLIQNYTISYALSLSTYSPDEKPPPAARYEVVAFGNPVIDGKFSESEVSVKEHLPLFSPIPSTLREIDEIRDIFKGERNLVFIGSNFSHRNFKKFAPGARILHIATHFINNLHCPQHAALLFSSDPGEDPFFYAHRVRQLSLGADLVVLSACESSEKNLMGLKGLVGMTASFKMAGVKSLLVSMWPVDEQNSLLIPLFYRYLKSDQDKAEALRQAKVDLIRDVKPFQNGLKISFSHPFLWSNYILYDFDIFR